GTNLELIGGKLPDNGSADKELILPFDYVSVLGFKNPDDAVEKEVKIAITSAAGESRMVTATIVGVQEKSLMSIGGASVNDSLLRALVAIQSEGKPAAAPEGYVAVVARMTENSSEEDMNRIKQELKDKGYDAQ